MPTMPTESDLINDDLPTNRDFIDASLGPVAAFRELSDNESDPSDSVEFGAAKGRILHPMGIQIIEDYFRSLPPEDVSGDSR
jgi:autophagy-related protein 2